MHIQLRGGLVTAVYTIKVCATSISYMNTCRWPMSLVSLWQHASDRARKSNSKQPKQQTKESDKKAQATVSKAREGLLLHLTVILHAQCTSAYVGK